MAMHTRQKACAGSNLNLSKRRTRIAPVTFWSARRESWRRELRVRSGSNPALSASPWPHFILRSRRLGKGSKNLRNPVDFAVDLDQKRAYVPRHSRRSHDHLARCWESVAQLVEQLTFNQ
jgi:hypothetical protein